MVITAGADRPTYAGRPDSAIQQVRKSRMDFIGSDP
jgi:hypothetical protein